MRSYRIVTFKTGFFSGNIKPTKLESTLNDEAKNGWRFVRSIHETVRSFIIFKRESHFLVFEKEA